MISLAALFDGWLTAVCLGRVFIHANFLVYAACVTAFVTQTLIGGARLIYMPLFIYQQAVGANNWPFAAAISVIFMVAVLVVVAALNGFGRRFEKHV